MINLDPVSHGAQELMSDEENASSRYSFDQSNRTGRNLFEGSHWLLAWADSIEEVKTVCWRREKATYNAIISNGRVVK